MVGYDLPDYGQAQAGPAFARREIRKKEAVLIFQRESPAGIADLYANRLLQCVAYGSDLQNAGM